MLKKIFFPLADVSADITLRDKLIFAGKIGVSLSLLVYFVLKLGAVDLLVLFHRADTRMLLFAVLLLIPNLFVQYLKWQLLCKEQLGVADNRAVFLSLMHGFAAAAFTPARLGELVGRKFALPDVRLFEISVSTLIDKYISLFVTVLIGAFTTILYLHYRQHISFYVTLSLFLLLLFFFYLLTVLIFRQGILRDLVEAMFNRVGFLKRFVPRLEEMRRINKRVATLLLLYSLLFYASFLLQYMVLLAAFSGRWDPLQFAWAGSLMFFVKSVVPAVSLSELGIREAASVFFLHEFGYAGEIGFDAAFTLFLVNILLPSLMGMLLLGKKGR